MSLSQDFINVEDSPCHPALCIYYTTLRPDLHKNAHLFYSFLSRSRHVRVAQWSMPSLLSRLCSLTICTHSFTRRSLLRPSVHRDSAVYPTTRPTYPEVTATRNSHDSTLCLLKLTRARAKGNRIDDSVHFRQSNHTAYSGRVQAKR